jgi:hypothetical protein
MYNQSYYLKGVLYMQEEEKKHYWSPYFAGACAGVVLVLSVWFTGKYFGASTSFVRSAGLIEKIFSAERVDQMAYFVAKTPKIEWQWMFVVGILIGALIASRISGTFRVQAIPDMWQERFGTNISRRAIVAFVGGTIAMFGARLAGG